MQTFGGKHSEQKLQAVSEYLKIYTTALSRQNFELVYFDAFAGSGEFDPSKKTKVAYAEQKPLFDFPQSEDVGEVAEFTYGSAKRALMLARPFDRYIFVEKDPENFKRLLNLKQDFPNLAKRIECVQGDANDELRRFCDPQVTNWRKTRAVVFLDPYGSQVDFNTLSLLAATEAVDLWYLFPSFLSVYRQISGKGKTTHEQERSINRILGTEDWKGEWIQPSFEPDFFIDSEERTKKQVEIDDITRFMIRHLKKEFRGGVLDSWLPLGENGAHWYSLLFAWANPSEKAKIASKFASHVLKKSK